jgi:hypothetical protein
MSVSFLGLMFYILCTSRASKAREVESKNTVETARPGSTIYTSEVPDYMVGLYQETETARVYHGSGFRIDGHLVAPSHVVRNGELAVFHKGKCIQWVNPKDWTEIATDVSVIPVDKYTSQVSKALVRPSVGRPYVRVQAAAPTNNAAFGNVSGTANVCFGQVEFTGSTRAGFSGACYVDVNKVYGMHLGGGAINYGASASFIQMRLKQRTQAPEDSPLQAIKMALRNLSSKKDWELGNTGSPGEYELRVGDQYFFADDEIMEQLRSDEWLEDYFYGDEEKVQKKRKYRQEPEALVPVTAEEVELIVQAALARYIVAPLPQQRTVGTTVRPKRFDVVTQTEESVVLENAMDEEPEWEESKTFLEQDMRPLIESILQPIKNIQDSLVSQIQELTTGLQLQQQQLSNLSASMPDYVKRQVQTSETRLLTSFDERLMEHSRKIQSDFDEQFSQVSQDLTSISRQCLERSNQRAQQGSESSVNTQQSETPSALMDSAFAQYKEWRISNKPSSPNFMRLRAEFLDRYDLSSSDKARLIRRYHNWWNKQKQRMAREIEPLEQTT